MYITILVKQVYWYIYQVSGERLQDHWSSGLLFLLKNIDCGYSLEPPQLEGGSNVYPQYMLWSKNKKNSYTPAYPSFVICGV